MNQKILSVTLFLFGIFPGLAMASLESTLQAVQTKLTMTILPTCAILGLLFAAFSFFMGSQNARGHFVLAILGAIIGFGASSIVQFIQQLIH